MAVILSFAGKTPALHPDAFVAPQTSIIGDVVVGAASSIWFGTVIRGDVMPIRIGEATSIQDNSVIHVTDGVAGTTVGDRVTVGHRVILHACVVEDDCLIGMGAIILDGARIGRGSVVGAGALVTPGTDIPPGSFVLGAPARVRRPVEERERAWIAGSAAHYVALARTYRS
ncbi:MAG: gamma carbonic anhydrase family protein [Kofleriaceae bacterium]